MKSICGLLPTIALLGWALAHMNGCATSHADWEAKCGPQVDPLLKPCSCMDPRTLSCPKPPSDATRKDGGAPDVDASAGLSLIGAATSPPDPLLLAGPPDLLVTVYGGNRGGATTCMDGMHSVTPMAPGVVCLRDGLTFTEALCGMKKSERENAGGGFSGSDTPWADAIVDLMHRLPDSACGQAIDAMDTSEPNCPSGSVIGVFEGGHVGCGTADGRYLGPLIHHYFPRYDNQGEGRP